MALVVLFSLAGVAGAAHGQPAASPAAGKASAVVPAPAPPVDEPPDGAAIARKKTAYLSAKSAADDAAAKAAWQAQLDARIGKAPAPVINIYNTWTHEYLVVPAGANVGEGRVDTFLRCHFTNEPSDMDPRLFDTLIRAARHFGVDRIDIVSGFRAPKYNLMLRKKGREVARNSQHTLGHAVDFRLPGVPVRKLHAWAKSLRLGGVGLYVHSGFIHVDVGPVRYWGGK